MVQDLVRGTTLTKAELVSDMQQQLGVSQREAKVLLETTLELIKEGLADPADGQLKISGFGNFIVRTKSPRMGRNPRTLKQIVISRRRVLVFKPSHLLRAAMNSERPQ